MLIGRSIIAASAITAAVAVILIAVHPRDAVPVMRTVTSASVFDSKRLSDANLVDWLLMLPIDTKLKRADWSSATLSIELVVPPEQPLDVEAVKTMMRDAEQIWRMSFLQLSNVDRVLLRIGESPQASSDAGLYSGAEGRPAYRLLLAADVRRTDRWIGEGEAAWRGIEDADTDPLWRERLRLSFTALWEAKRNAAFTAGQQQSIDNSTNVD